MIAAIPIETVSRESKISSRFARSPYFAIVYSQVKELKIITNPCAELESGTGKCLANHLYNEYGIDTYVAFELGWKMQQLAYKSETQLIILDNKNKLLEDVLKYMKIK